MLPPDLIEGQKTFIRKLELASKIPYPKTTLPSNNLEILSTDFAPLNKCDISKMIFGNLAQRPNQTFSILLVHCVMGENGCEHAHLEVAGHDIHAHIIFPCHNHVRIKVFLLDGTKLKKLQGSNPLMLPPSHVCRTH